MTLEEERKMAMLEATLKEIKSVVEDCKNDKLSIPPEEAFDGKLLIRWRKAWKHLNQLV